MLNYHKSVCVLIFVLLASLSVIAADDSITSTQDSKNDTVAQVAQVRIVADTWLASIVDRDAQANNALYTADIIIAGESRGETLIGRDQVSTFVRGLLEVVIPKECLLNIHEIHIHGDWAELRATFSGTWEPTREGMESESQVANYVWLLKRQNDNTWKIARFLYYNVQ